MQLGIVLGQELFLEQEWELFQDLQEGIGMQKKKV